MCFATTLASTNVTLNAPKERLPTAGGQNTADFTAWGRSRISRRKVVGLSVSVLVMDAPICTRYGQHRASAVWERAWTIAIYLYVERNGSAKYTGLLSTLRL